MYYEEVKRRIIYSREMKVLNSRISPVKGVSDARMLADRVQSMSEYIAINNGLDKDYCGVLALAKHLGIPPYGKEGKVALDEILGEGFSQANANLFVLARILDEECPERLRRDLISIHDESLPFDQLTEEAKVVRYASETYEYFYLLNDEEKEKLGGSLLLSVLQDEIKKDGNGQLTPGKNFNRLKQIMASRRKEIDIDKKEKAKEMLQTRIMQATIEEQHFMDKIIGE